MKKKIILLLFSLFLTYGFTQSNGDYLKYENSNYSFKLPKTWIIPNQNVTDDYIKKEKSIALANKIKYNNFDFLFSAKGENKNILYVPIIKVTTMKTNKNLFSDMKKQFGSDYIEKEINMDGETLKFGGKPIIDSKNQIISITMNSEDIFGQTIMYFSEKSIVQFTYTDNKSEKCVDCLVLYYMTVTESFKFK